MAVQEDPVLGASGGQELRGADMPWLTPFPAPRPVEDARNDGAPGAGGGGTATATGSAQHSTTRPAPVSSERPPSADAVVPGVEDRDVDDAGEQDGGPRDRGVPDAAVEEDQASAGRGEVSGVAGNRGGADRDPELSRALGNMAGSPSWGSGVNRVSMEPDPSMTSRLTGPLLGAALGPLSFAIAAIVIVIIDDTLASAALVVAAVGLIIGAVGAVSAWRRLHADVDVPARELTEAVVRLGAGEPVEHVEGPDRGPLVSVARALDSAGASVSSSTDRLVEKARWGEQSRQILDALEFARNDTQVYRVVSEALELVDDEHPSELLMTTSPTSTELASVAANRTTGSPGCPVGTTADCMAIRRAQVVVTDSSEAINACPRLRDRPEGPVSAVCVPVSTDGHGVGVIHAIGADRHPPSTVVVDRLSELARHLGARLSGLRAIESSQEEASTDGLTGLPNRRALEASLQQMLDSRREFVAVLADLDKFKSVNDKFGHEAGDRALQLFARVMQDNVRGHDLVARVGGEEFVVAYPDMSVQGSIEAIERLRTGLASAVAVASVQPFTCSYGVTHSAVGSTVGEILRVADAGLLRAKELGGDRVVYADQALAAEMFDNPDTRRPDTGGDGGSARSGGR